MRTGPVHKSSKETREKNRREDVKWEESVPGRKPEMRLDLKRLGILLDAWVNAEVILPTLMKRYRISGTRMTNPEIITRIMKRGRKSGRWLGVTVIRED